MSRRRRRRTKPPPESLTLSATDADWVVVRTNAERRGLSISRYVVALVLSVGWDARDGSALALSRYEQREMFETVRSFRALMGDEAKAPPPIKDMQARVRWRPTIRPERGPGAIPIKSARVSSRRLFSKHPCFYVAANIYLKSTLICSSFHTICSRSLC